MCLCQLRVDENASANLVYMLYHAASQLPNKLLSYYGQYIAFTILSLRSIRIPNVVYQLTVTTLWGRLNCLVLNDMGKFLRSNVVWKSIFHRFFMKWRWDFKTAKGRGIMCRCSDIISRRLVCINGCGQVGIITLWWRKNNNLRQH